MTFDPENTDTALPIYTASLIIALNLFYCLNVENSNIILKSWTF